MTDAVLTVRGLEKRYGSFQAVDGVSFDLARGEVLTLFGPSGCGKSTTLRLVAGLEEPDGGEIAIGGRVVASASQGIFVAAEKRNVGLVFQSYAVWPHMTVAQNVAYPLEVRGVARAECRRRVEAVLELVELQPFADRPATQLSGGQQQRVSLARALVYEPDLLLLDEPLSNLDAKLREQMRVQLRGLQERLGMTLLYVTHDQLEAMSLSNRVAVMRQGRIEQLGSPVEVYEQPASFFVQDFVGRTLTLDGEVAAANGSGVVRLDSGGMLTLPAARLPAVGARVRVAVRPEDVTLEPLTDGIGESALRGTLEDLIYHGDCYACVVRVGADTLVIDTAKQRGLTRGQPVLVRCNAAKLQAWPLPA